MGVDFIRRAAKSFERSWDTARLELATADLFTQAPVCEAPSAAFDIATGKDLRVGDQVIVEKSGNTLVARQGFSEIAHSWSPPSEIMNAVDSSCGMAKGTVGQIHQLAHVAEISLC